jgi:hypothetical protein
VYYLQNNQHKLLRCRVEHVRKIEDRAQFYGIYGDVQCTYCVSPDDKESKQFPMMMEVAELSRQKTVHLILLILMHDASV